MPTPESDVRRRELAREAAAVFAELGYHTASVDDIADAAGLGKATLYHYFRSKHEILYWIHEEFIDTLMSRHTARLGTEMSARQRLLAIMEDLVEPAGTPQRGGGQVFFENYGDLPEEFAKPIAEKRSRYSKMVEQEITRGIDEGEIRKVDPRVTAFAIFGMCNWTYRWYRADGPLLARDVAQSFWDLLLRGLEPSSSAAAHD